MKKRLNLWFYQYVDQEPDYSSEESRTRRPFADAQIVIEETEGDPGFYKAKCYLRPHHQLEGPTTLLRLITTLPAEYSA